jgi:acetyl-CoA carboxylase biotin carboxyl carrier protein
MAGSSSNQDIFDVRKIRRLVALMNEHDLSEIDLRQGDMRIQLRRSHEGLVAVAPPPSAPSAPVGASRAPAPAPPPNQASHVPVQNTVIEEHVALIKSPMVGTFYSAPDPDSPPYVKMGDPVSADTTVCIVEAMKVFNEILAEVSGKIVSVLVENGEPVEFGQPMFKVDTRQ